MSLFCCFTSKRKEIKCENCATIFKYNHVWIHVAESLNNKYICDTCILENPQEFMECYPCKENVFKKNKKFIINKNNNITCRYCYQNLFGAKVPDDIKSKSEQFYEKIISRIDKS